MHASDKRLAYVGFRPTGDLAGLTAYTRANKKVVWFPKSPPKKPASLLQIRQHRLFGAAAMAWRTLSPHTRACWKRAADRAGLYLTGYTLWMWWTLSPDPATMRTIERISETTLVH